MPAKSAKQARLFRAAKHGATFPMAKKIRASMSDSKMAEFEHTASKHGNRYHDRLKP